MNCMNDEKMPAGKNMTDVQLAASARHCKSLIVIACVSVPRLVRRVSTATLMISQT